MVRKLCPHCSEKHNLTEEQIQRINKLIEEMPQSYRQEEFNTDNIKKPSEKSSTCSKCSDGYKGRIGVFEVFEVTDSVGKVYKEFGAGDDLEAEIKKQNLPFLKDDGLWKVLTGVTSIEEIERIIGVNI